MLLTGHNKEQSRVYGKLTSARIELLSKTLSYMLRHKPAEFKLELDARGFAPLRDAIQALRKMAEWRQLTQQEIELLVRSQSKKRFEICDNKIRAIYGHTISQQISYQGTRPPSILFHGTSPTSLDRILREGLRPMGRQYVHLSTTQQSAYEVGCRKHPCPVILKIRARAASLTGIEFFKAGDMFLSRHIPSEYICEVSKEH